MHYKKFFSATALVTLLSLSHSAFSDSSPVGLTDEEDSTFYIRGQYNGELPFKTKIDGIAATGAAPQGGGAAPAVDPFKASFIGGGAAFGYKMEDFRFELEGLYSQLNKNADDGVTATPGTATNLTVFSGLINGYYDLAMDMSITPYIGVGVGAAYINNPLATPLADSKTSGFGFAYQAKIGASYAVTPEINLYAGARYFGAYGAKFDKTKDDGAHKVLYSVVGAEAGVMFNF